MKRASTRKGAPKATKAELAYIRHGEKFSATERLKRGDLEFVDPRDYPKPLKRSRDREQLILHIRLSPPVRRRIER